MLKFLLKYFFLFLGSIVAMVENCKAQDIQFSQYYAVPFYQNPAFAGGLHHSRGVLHQRIQWPGLDSRYSSTLASFDTYISKYNSSIGIVAVQDYQGSGIISTTDLNLLYAYELNLSDEFSFRPALQLGVTRRKVDYSELTFPEQFTDKGFTGSSVAGSSLGANSLYYPDVAAGGLFYNKKGWIAVAGHHLNMPNQSFYGDVSKLPIKLSIIGGHKITIKKVRYMAYLENEKDFSITPTFHYKSQGKSDQLDLGVYFIWDKFQAGLWYRGIPVKKYSKKLINNESIIPMLGYRINNFILSYSYDISISRLTAARSYGAHEFNITYVAYSQQKKRVKPLKRLPCPKF